MVLPLDGSAVTVKVRPLLRTLGPYAFIWAKSSLKSALQRVTFLLVVQSNLFKVRTVLTYD